MEECGVVIMRNGKSFNGEKVEELAAEVISILSDAGLSYRGAKMVLERTEEIVDEYSLVQKAAAE